MLNRLLLLFIILFIAKVTFSDVQAQDIVRGEKIQQEQPQQSVVIMASGSVVTVKNAQQGSTMHVYNIVGQKVASFKIESQECSFALSVPKGYYIVKVGTVVRKIIVR